ncbi:Zinc-type alcohol dehydrogenase-like protein C2E1P3.01 [Hypsizygus marmoreus]|uniref:Zinc-type alcohol dehydrogenase-like protein C2E1P3.01 n=1 Tax=Hypsizygus marmoreus TaxID=39966 RepID=A0A369KDX0_HYPMA|nr:Zinc-type alcohol dehydrogenase-like protein C2E1P3.01 [Hypsizygus marmoreus]
MSSNPQQKALFLESKQGQLVLGTREIHKPGPGELLVKVLATSLNPVDWKIQKYGVFLDNFPAVLGTDVAGEVEQVGEGVTEFSKGDRVFCQGTFENEGASFQQYTLTTAATTAKIPSNLSFDAVSTIPVALTAAYVGLYHYGPYGLELASPLDPSNRGKYAGNPLVVLGGSSSVGQYAIQLAKASGFSPIITTSSLKHADYLKSLGATEVIDRHTPLSGLAAEIKKVTDLPIRYVFDAISTKETQQAGHDLLTSGGHLVVTLNPNLAKSDDINVVQVLGILRLPQNFVLLKDMYSRLTASLEEGVIQPNRYEVLPHGLEGIIEGLQRLQNDEISGLKLVARPHDS